mmetsp:Transcript_2663/g.3459  ORF Transcript_2663/g.3459 Transcript_2663/m.3459 type:complete len:440 (+) Transcript_2663:4586-5905(+)
MIRRIGDLLNRGDFDDFQKVELGCRVFFTLHNQHVLEALVVFGAIQRLAVAQTVELIAFQRFCHRTRRKGARTLHSVSIEQGLHIAGVRSLARREAVFGAEGAHKGLGAFVLQRPVPVGGAKDALHVGARTFRHQAGVERNNDLEVLAVYLLVAQAELHRVGERVHHVAAVVVQNQRIGARLQNRSNVGREVGLGQRGFDRRNSFPAHRLGRGTDGFFCGVTPVVVRCQVIGLAVLAVRVCQHRCQGCAGHVGVEEVTEAIGAFVFASGVVGVRQARHEDHARLLAERLHGHGHTRGRTTGDHDSAVFFDHRLGRCACRVRFGLGVAGDVFHLFAQDAVTLQRLGAEGVQHAAVAATVQVFDRQLIRAQLVCAFVGIGACLGHVEAQRHAAAGGFVGIRMCALRCEDRRQRQAGTGKCTGFQQAATAYVSLGHVILPSV